LSCILLLIHSARVSADEVAELRRLVEENNKKISELTQQVQALKSAQAASLSNPIPIDDTAVQKSPIPIDDAAVQKIVGQYLKDHPGAGMPSGVQTGYVSGQGFVIRSAPNPPYANWDDDCKIPFEIRFRARAMLSYIRFTTTDPVNHVTNRPATANANSNRLPNFSQLEVKRLNLIWEGTAFDPDLRYRFELNGFTRGLPGLQNNKVVQTTPAGGFAPNGSPVSPIGGGVLVDHGVSVFEAWIAYDFHGCATEKGCGPDCPEGTYKYAPTYTVMVGKLKPFFGLEEFLRNTNMQFVEFSMADWYFSSDDDARLMAAGFQVKAAEDRFLMMALVTNGSEGSFIPNAQMDDFKGFIGSFWYDLGGSWNAQRKAWDLFGDSISDIDFSCQPVVRLGGGVNVVPMDRRSLYGDAEQARLFVMPAGIGGTRLINVLNGDTATPSGAHDVDKLGAYFYNAFVAAKYHGFSVYNEWWLRNITGFHTTHNGNDNIIYQDTLGPGGANVNALFPRQHGLLDYGFALQAGYFLIPKKLEVAARWSWLRGDSGDINGNGTFRTVTVAGVTGPVHIVNGAFHQFHEANEYTVGLNYFFRRHNLKWQTDFGIYEGGNPAGNGQSLAGYITGQDGWMLRTQIQILF
jgi:hypothetical protein